MKASAIVAVQAVFLVSLVVGCAKTPATTAATAPAPTGGERTAGGGVGGGATSGATSGGMRADGTRQAASSGKALAGIARPSLKEFVESSALRDIHFDFDKAELRPEAQATLDQDAIWMKANPNHLVLIEGHCDERGTTDYNVALGERRARATMNYLVSQGVKAGRLTVVSYGEERAQCGEHTEACWAQNRRAHFLVKAQ